MNIAQPFWYIAYLLVLLGVVSSSYVNIGGSRSGRLTRFHNGSKQGLSLGTKCMQSGSQSNTIRWSLILHAGNQDVLEDISELGNVYQKGSIAKSYYLIQSPGMIKKTIISLCVLVATQTIFSIIKFPSIPIVNNKSLQFFLPFLASACCAGQLLINLIITGASCAGFNKVLGPMRPISLALLILLTSQARLSMLHKTLPMVCLSWIIAIMPEFVHWLNSKCQLHIGVKQYGIAASHELLSSTINLEIPGMGCVACVNKVIMSLRNASLNSQEAKVVNVRSWLVDNKPGGLAQVDVLHDSKSPIGDITFSLATALRESGFECEVI